MKKIEFDVGYFYTSEIVVILPDKIISLYFEFYHRNIVRPWKCLKSFTVEVTTKITEDEEYT